MGRLIGYARVSTAGQGLSLQLEALRHTGCRDEQIFWETVSWDTGSTPWPGSLFAGPRPWRHTDRVALGSSGAVDDPFGDYDRGVTQAPGGLSVAV
jgi:hypothetical protein